MFYAGNDHQSAQQLLETLWAYEEWKSDKKIDSDADFVARAAELQRHHWDYNPPPEQSQTTGPAATQPAASNSEESICVVCMSAPCTVVLIPCGHRAVCQSCYSRLPQCPVCRSVILGAIRSETKRVHLSTKTGLHSDFGLISHSGLTALNYFFVQTPSNESGSQQLHFPNSDAMHYDRGTIANQMDIEETGSKRYRTVYHSHIRV